MAIYAIGDVQGCFAELQALLEKIDFNPTHDQLWLVGDLVNRGPASLETLRFLKGLGERAVCVLGNHDIYLLKVAATAGLARKRNDTLQAVLEAPDRIELIDWLRTRPLAHLAHGHLMVHAGVLPLWSSEDVISLAAEVQRELSGPRWGWVIDKLWGNQPAVWDERLEGFERMRVIVNALTRMRFCSLRDGRMEFVAKGGEDKAPPGFVPWFTHPLRRSRDVTLVCGHWSALGLRIEDNLLALDSGCVWGGPFTAIRLEDRQVFQVAADPQRRKEAS